MIAIAIVLISLLCYWMFFVGWGRFWLEHFPMLLIAVCEISYRIATISGHFFA